MAKKKESGVLGTVLIVGGIGLAAYMISKSMPKLPTLPGISGGDGVSITSPIDFSLGGLGLDGLLPTGLPLLPRDETESGCTPLGLRGGSSGLIQDIIDVLGLGKKDDIVIDLGPDVIVETPDFTREGATFDIQSTLINIGGESWEVTPQIPPFNIGRWEYVWERIKKAFIDPQGILNMLTNLRLYGSEIVAIEPMSEEGGRMDAPPICEGAACDVGGGWRPFFLPLDLGGEAPADSEAATKTTTPTVYAPAPPAIIGGGGEKKELYIL